MDNMALGLGLLIMSFVTFFVLPGVSYSSVRMSPGFAWGGLLASGVLFVSGIVFVLFAYKYDKRANMKPY